MKCIGDDTHRMFLGPTPIRQRMKVIRALYTNVGHVLPNPEKTAFVLLVLSLTTVKSTVVFVLILTLSRRESALDLFRIKRSKQLELTTPLFPHIIACTYHRLRLHTGWPQHRCLRRA